MASAVALGAIITSEKTLIIFSAVEASNSLLETTIPPKALTGSEARANL